MKKQKKAKVWFNKGIELFLAIQFYFRTLQTYLLFFNRAFDN